MNDKTGKPITVGKRVEFFDTLTEKTIRGKVTSLDGENLLTVSARREPTDPPGPFQFHANQVTIVK